MFALLAVIKSGFEIAKLIFLLYIACCFVFIFSTFAIAMEVIMKVRQDSLKAWFLAARPQTLSGAAVPVMIGLSLSLADGGIGNFSILPALLCLLFAFIMQIDANFVNDYFDFVRGNDDGTRLGPKRACAQGWVRLRSMKMAIAFSTVIACVVGLPLVFYGGWMMIVVGGACVLFCFLYTTVLCYRGLGDLLVLVFFGIVPVTMTYYLQSGTVTLESLLASVACGVVIDTLLIVNNYRDIDNDRRAGKNTLVVKLGANRSLRMYFYCGYVACLIGGIFYFSGHHLAFELPVIYIIFHMQTYNEMVRIKKGAALNRILGKTARNIFVYGLLVSAGLLISCF